MAPLRRTRPAHARPRRTADHYTLIAVRDLSYGALSKTPGLGPLIVRWQTWVLVPGIDAGDPILRRIAERQLRHARAALARTGAGHLSALCVVFYTALDLDACLGCYEWAPKGDWNLAGLSGRTGDYQRHRWKRLPFEPANYINQIGDVVSCRSSR